MNASLVNSVSDKEFIEIVGKSKTINDIARYLGFKHSPGCKSRERIKNRMLSLGISISDICKNTDKEDIKESNYISSNHIGLVGEKKFEYLCAIYQIPCLKENAATEPYDYLININNEFLRIQVKTCEFKNDEISYIFSTRHGNFYNNTNSRYNSDTIDYYFLHCIEDDKSFLIKYEKPTYDIIIRDKSKNNQKKNIIFSKDVCFERVVDKLLNNNLFDNE